MTIKHQLGYYCTIKNHFELYKLMLKNLISSKIQNTWHKNINNSISLKNGSSRNKNKQEDTQHKQI